jgi:predicted nucleic acid-binding protein
VTTFVDTSAWYAAADGSDVDHDAMTRALAGAGTLLTSDHVLVETWLLLNRRLGRREAESFVRTCVTGGLAIESVGRPDLEKALEIARRFSDQRFSLVDRTSFSVMERLGIETVVSLDADFAIYRFGPRRQRSFTVLR